MAELADALDLGSSVNDVGVQVLFPAPSRLPKSSSHELDGGCPIDDINLTVFNAVGLFFLLNFLLFSNS